MVFVIRLRTSKGTTRLMFESDKETWGSLQLQIQDVLKVPISAQQISRNPGNKDEVKASSNQTLSALKLANGDMLYMNDTPAGKTTTGVSGGVISSSTSSSSSSSSSSKPTVAKGFTLTSRCTHGTGGRCLNCAAVDMEEHEEQRKQGGESILCTHGSGAKCIHCIPAAGKGTGPLPEWLCNHADSVFCPKCIPKQDESERATLKCSCDKKKGQSCVRCLHSDAQPTIKVDKIPYKQFMAEKRALCKYKHGDNTTCVMCADPELPVYAGKKDCDRGHQPWPKGVCLKCAPQNATLRVQPYRHCDNISLHATLVQEFYRAWIRSGEVQQAALLFGTYADEPDTTRNQGAVRAEVQALYVPPQVIEGGVIHFSPDPIEKVVWGTAAKLGFVVVGWVLTTLPREGKKYKGKVFLSGAEIQQAAKFQNRFQDSKGHSRFVTVVIEHEATVEPRAYQVSEQCVALERDGGLQPAEDPILIAAAKPKQGEIAPTIIHRDKPLQPGQEFIPDEFLVKVIASNPLRPTYLLKSTACPQKASTSDIKRLVKGGASGPQGLSRFSDFHLLHQLVGYIGEKLVSNICDALRIQGGAGAMDQKLAAEVDNALRTKGLL